MGAQRIQRRRTRGWRMPEDAVYVGRPTRWGNPYSIEGALENGFASNVEEARKVCVTAFRCWLRGDWYWRTSDPKQERRRDAIVADVSELRGRDLVCWCPLEDEHGNRVPCHADVLLELANSCS